MKYELDKCAGLFALSGVMHSSMFYPADAVLILQTYFDVFVGFSACSPVCV